MGEMNKSLMSAQATVKRDLVLAPERQEEAVCPLNALLQSQQPHANSLSPLLGSVPACHTACYSAHTRLEAAAPLQPLVSLDPLIARLFVNQGHTRLHLQHNRKSQGMMPVTDQGYYYDPVSLCSKIHHNTNYFTKKSNVILLEISGH